MWDWFKALSTVEKIFVFCAAVGGVLFAIRLVLMFMGAAETDTDVDADVDVDVDADVDVAAHVDEAVADAGDIGASDFSFKILSFQGLTAFFSMFGLVGLAMMRNSGAAAVWAILVGAVAGLIAVWAISWMFTFFKRMQHSGTLDLRNAVGREGRVYMNIPEDEPGKVQVDVQGRLTILDAVSEDKSNIPTDTRVKVVNVISGNVLVVRKA